MGAIHSKLNFGFVANVCVCASVHSCVCVRNCAIIIQTGQSASSVLCHYRNINRSFLFLSLMSFERNNLTALTIHITINVWSNQLCTNWMKWFLFFWLYIRFVSMSKIFDKRANEPGHERMNTQRWTHLHYMKRAIHTAKQQRYRPLTCNVNVEKKHIHECIRIKWLLWFLNEWRWFSRHYEHR